MRVEGANSIQQYMEYLKQQHGLHITLHPQDGVLFDIMTNLAVYNYHTNPYCVFLKMNGDVNEKCVACQEKVRRHCAKYGAFFGMCHAGAEEFIYPITCNRQDIGFISVGGYRKDWEKACGKIRNLALTYNIDFEKAVTFYKTYLSPDIPDKRFMDSVIMPLVSMIELFYLRWNNSRKKEIVKTNADVTYNLIFRHINNYYNQDITVQELSRRFGCSPSYISHIFKQKNGNSISNYINQIRLQNAKQLLDMDSFTVREVASAVGFNDSNYFSTVFKKFYGKSPLQWKKSRL